MSDVKCTKTIMTGDIWRHKRNKSTYQVLGAPTSQANNFAGFSILKDGSTRRRWIFADELRAQFEFVRRAAKS